MAVTILTYPSLGYTAK